MFANTIAASFRNASREGTGLSANGAVVLDTVDGAGLGDAFNQAAVPCRIKRLKPHEGRKPFISPSAWVRNAS